jgi:branched-chain amino acid transport system permease protein
LFSAHLVLASLLGGTRHFLGPVLGAFAFVGLDEVASQWTVGRYMMFGVLLIFVVLVFPQGIAGGLAALAAKMKRIQPWRRYEQS